MSDTTLVATINTEHFNDVFKQQQATALFAPELLASVNININDLNQLIKKNIVTEYLKEEQDKAIDGNNLQTQTNSIISKLSNAFKSISTNKKSDDITIEQVAKNLNEQGLTENNSKFNATHNNTTINPEEHKGKNI